MCQVQQRKLSRVSSIVLDLVKYNVNSIALHKKHLFSIIVLMWISILISKFKEHK